MKSVKYRLLDLGILGLVLLFLVLKFRLSSSQDSIVFPTEIQVNPHDEEAWLTMDGIPEKLLIRMKDVYNASDFMQNFVVPNHDYGLNRDNVQFVNARRAFAAAAAGFEIAQFADCRPEPQVVKLQKPPSSGVMLWPPCVRVKRCGGCCTSKLLTCRPTEVSTLNVTVLQVRISPDHLDAFESEGHRVIGLEQHDKCRCSCKQLPEECIPTIQEYRPSECRCACIDQERALQCEGTQRIWDDSDCSCKCRYPSECSTGFFYSFRSCRCEVFRASLLGPYRPATTRDYGRIRYVDSTASAMNRTSRNVNV